MHWKNTLSKYGTIAKSFHWVMALLIIGMLCVGFYMTSSEKTLSIIKLYATHKSIGMTILFLAVLRLLWRWMNPVPPLPDTMPKWQHRGAHLSHYALYFLMFAMPVVGWLMSSSVGFGVSVYGWFTLPPLISTHKEWTDSLRLLHWLGSWALAILIGLHALAALYHHFFQHDSVLRRMLPFGKD